MPTTPVDRKSRVPPAEQHPGAFLGQQTASAQGALLGLIAILVGAQELPEMPVRAAPQRRGAGLPRAVGPGGVLAHAPGSWARGCAI